MPIHLFVAHAPFTLILIGAGLDLLGVATADAARRRTAGALLMAGSFLALAAFFTGQAAVGHAFGRPAIDYAMVETHTQWAGAGVWLLAAAGGLRAAWRNQLRGAYGWLNLAVALLSVLLIVGITYSGLRIAHGG